MKKLMALALAGVMAFAAVSVAVGADKQTQQTLDAKLTPTKLSKKKFKAAKIFVDIETGINDEDPGSNQPPSANRTQVDFPKNMKFDTGAVPRCDVPASQLETTTTEEATAKCGKDSVVSVDPTSAQVQIGSPSGPIPLDAVVTAFNGNKKNTLYLHSYVAAFGNTTILPGKLKKGPKGFGKTLDVTVPELDAGAISKFITTVKAGKFVQARCKSKMNKFQARTSYDNHKSTTATDSAKCKRKKSGGGRKGGRS